MQIQRIGGKNGSKRHLQVDERGVPLAMVITGANVHDAKGLPDLLDAVIIVRPEDTDEHLCLDAGYVGEPVQLILAGHNYIGHVRPRGEETRRNRRHKPRRWIVEVAHSWFNRFRKLIPRYEKSLASCNALHRLAAAIICFRMAGTI